MARRPRKSFGVTAPAVSLAIRSGQPSSEGNSPSQIWVMRPGETPTARDKVLRGVRVRQASRRNSIRGFSVATWIRKALKN